MNKAIIMGRLTKDPDIRTTQTQTAVATFTVAVDRRFKSANGEKQADFIPVVAWRQQADFVGKYFKKGSKIIVIGSIQTRTYDDKDGKKVYVTEIVADELEFAESKREDGSGSQYPAAQQNSGSQSNSGFPPASNGDGFFTTSDDDTSLPFDL
ncbi:MAG: single-stranded DNA-binding protein [Saccharofermentanales bacterium]